MLRKRSLTYFAFAIFFGFICRYNIKKYPLLMPNVTPDTPDLYLCTSARVNFTKNYYITGFEPNATMKTVHHMVIYGCVEPGSTKSVWNCGEMTNENKDLKIKTAFPCREGFHKIIYAWARDAPALNLPDGVGFKVGNDSSIQYIVLQVHYTDRFKDGRTDNSGVILHYTTHPTNKLAGIIVLGTVYYSVIRPGEVAHMESSCSISENKTIYPFAYRVHTHSLGKVVSGYVVKPNNEWIELGKRDPLTPQMFYPVTNKIPVTYGDRLAARCTIENTRDRPTYLGPTNKDEMCYFYIMYYVENDSTLKQQYCLSKGPPTYYWKQDFINIPDKEASTL